MSSLFSRLFRYRPSDDHRPKENFFTEALVGVLNKSDRLKTEFAKWLVGDLQIGGVEKIDEVELYTQRVLGVGLIDIWIDARNRRTGHRHVIAIENKIDAGEGDQQLQGYASALQAGHENAASRTLIYATLHERTDFMVEDANANVQFKPIHWFEVANWLRDWTADREDDPGTPFVRELLNLMKCWRMTMALNAGDLAVATTYHGSVQNELWNVLDQIHAQCLLPNTNGNWVYSTRGGYVSYRSPMFGPAHNTRIEFAFDFNRDDDVWSVPQLGLPSAYFAIYLESPSEEAAPGIDNLNDDWNDPPDEWGGNCHYPKVKQLSGIQIGNGNRLHLAYLEFLQDARQEVWIALGLPIPPGQ